MDTSKENAVPNPRDKANFLSVLFFTYTIGMFRKGYSTTLEVHDLYSPITSDKSKILGDRLERKWNKHVEYAKKLQKKPSLLKVLILTFWPEYLYLGFLLTIMDLVLRLIQPLFLGRLLDYFNYSKAEAVVSKNEALWYAGAIVILNFASAMLINQYVMNAFHYGMKVRAACCALIYRKALRLSRTALGDTASGKIVNLLSNDVSRFDIVSIFIHHMWVAPTAAIIVMYFLYVEAGYAGLIGIAPVFIVMPLQSYTGKLSAIYRKQTAQKTDERVRLMDEIISGVQVIKMYAWEIPFTKIIKLARKAELKIVTKSSYVRGLFMTFNLFTTRVALFCTLLTMAMTDQPITAAKVFVFMLYFNILSQTMSTMFVRGISEIAELFVAIKRLEEFMMNEEFFELKPSYINNNQNCNGNDDPVKKEDCAVLFKNMTAKWNKKFPDNALTDFNFSCRKGKLYGIIGPVGSGKSSLLQTILGELDITEGAMNVNGKLSYASQEPWVFAATVRQNILFGQKYDKQRYNEVVHVCALEKDFKQFPDGDMTVVGDRGASLSGGQKARINLARSVYRDADIYLLDDPLSAVDIHVARHLFDRCINGYLKRKTRILVTHQVHLLKQADEILIMNNGVIERQGTYQEISASEDAYAKGAGMESEVKNIYARLLSTEPEVLEEEKGKPLQEPCLIKRKLSTRSATVSLTSAVSEVSIPESLLQDNADPDEQGASNQEESSKGKVKGSLFWKYLSAGGNYFLCVFVLSLYILAQAGAMGIDYFVSFWTNIEEFRNYTITDNSTDSSRIKNLPNWSKEFCLYLYTGLIVYLFITALTRSMLFYKLAMISSQKLHDSLFKNVIDASMRFFDTNPSGRILNRFSKDIGSIDELLPKAILDAGQIILQMAGSLILVIFVNPYFLILVGAISIFFWALRVVYLRSSKNIKRLEGIMRSPVFTHLNATIQGLTTIRAYGAQKALRAEFDKHQDYHTSAWFMYIAASSAFGFFLDLLCFIFTALITFSFLILGEEVLGGQVGLAITQAAALTGLLQWGMRQSAEISNQLMSVERVLEYETLPKEKQPEYPKVLPPSWPDEGKIVFADMGLKYDINGTLVLKDLNLVIKPKEKVGIVGRTGAGKSSLISALFRLANVEGAIEIDGIDTKDVVLQQLRSRISIIPQDPVLFSGTLRYNLDPFEEYADADLYRAIDEVELKDPANISNKLENRVMDRGSNYSVGQRQLICLARAIVRNTRVLMLDEATANVDPQTDALIQKTIRKKFADCTVLTVAHRLNTIMDSDKVLVMEQGTMVEFDHPYVLLQNPEGMFYKMVMESGKTMADHLKRIARESFQRQNIVPE